MWAEQQPLVRAVAVFGSHAKGRAREDSDLDIAILIRAEDPSEPLLTWIDYSSQWEKELQVLLGFEKIHLSELSLDPASPKVEQYVRRCSIVAYDPEGIICDRTKARSIAGR